MAYFPNLCCCQAYALTALQAALAASSVLRSAVCDSGMVKSLTCAISFMCQVYHLLIYVSSIDFDRRIGRFPLSAQADSLHRPILVIAERIEQIEHSVSTLHTERRVTTRRRKESMATNPDERPVPKPPSSVIHWLLDSDPSIRWQA